VNESVFKGLLTKNIIGKGTFEQKLCRRSSCLGPQGQP
jgi:hypothetical protein